MEEEKKTARISSRITPSADRALEQAIAGTPLTKQDAICEAVVDWIKRKSENASLPKETTGSTTEVAIAETPEGDVNYGGEIRTVVEDINGAVQALLQIAGKIEVAGSGGKSDLHQQGPGDARMAEALANNATSERLQGIVKKERADLQRGSGDPKRAAR